MTALSQSAFLYALGWALMNSLWQMALLWLIYQLGFNLHKKIKPAIRNLAGVSLLFAGFLWFILSFAGKIIEFNAVQKYLITLPATEETPLSLNKVIFDSSSGLQSLIRVAEQYLPYLSSAYLIILLLLITRLINAFSYSQRLRNEGLIAIDEHWQLFVKKYAGKLGLSKPVQVYLSSLIDVPATLGYIKPVILLPVTLFNHLSVQQAEAVILHEISHIRRNDYLINILLSVIETILFFNPFSHLLAKNIKKEREMCCDDFVVRCQYDPHSYAAALLSLEKMRITAPAFAMAATGNKDQLLNRVKRILNVNSGNLNYGQRLLALFVMAGIISSMAWLSPSTENKSSKSSSEGKEAITAAELFNKTDPGKKLILVKKEGKKDSLIRMAQNKKPVTYQFDDLYVKSGPLLDTFVFDGDVMETEDLPEKLPFPVEERRIALAPLFSPDAPLVTAEIPKAYYNPPYTLQEKQVTLQPAWGATFKSPEPLLNNNEQKLKAFGKEWEKLNEELAKINWEKMSEQMKLHGQVNTGQLLNEALQKELDEAYKDQEDEYVDEVLESLRRLKEKELIHLRRSFEMVQKGKTTFKIDSVFREAERIARTEIKRHMDEQRNSRKAMEQIMEQRQQKTTKEKTVTRARGANVNSIVAPGAYSVRTNGHFSFAGTKLLNNITVFSPNKDFTYNILPQGYTRRQVKTTSPPSSSCNCDSKMKEKNKKKVVHIITSGDEVSIIVEDDE